ncbi:hypothetical protein PVAG01_10123 [Phlyctema vagabunda]|uniref:Uncharacterized protein n=1 Tax=Phlyctema vagabunda TaxID=108571 RepID=A0ABR4P575_9HELO
MAQAQARASNKQGVQTRAKGSSRQPPGTMPTNTKVFKQSEANTPATPNTEDPGEVENVEWNISEVEDPNGTLRDADVEADVVRTTAERDEDSELWSMMQWDTLQDGVKIRIISEISFKLPYYVAMWNMGLSEKQCRAFQDMYNAELDRKLTEMKKMDEKRTRVKQHLKFGQSVGEDNIEYTAATDELYASADYDVWEPLTSLITEQQAEDGRIFLASFDFILDLPGIEEVLNVVGSNGVDPSWFDIYMPDSHPGPCPWVDEWAIEVQVREQANGDDEEEEDGEEEDNQIEEVVSDNRKKPRATGTSRKSSGSKKPAPAPKKNGKKPAVKRPPAKKQKKSGLSQVINAEVLENAKVHDEGNGV